MTKTEIREKINNCTSKSLKNGNFKFEELELYNTHISDKDIILTYQKVLPILNVEDDIRVNARDLHNQLGVKTKFADWIERRIEKYGFEKDLDFSVSQKREMLKRGSTTSIEYSLTLSMAKELAMIENNDIGRLTRKYFQAIERAYKNRTDWNYDRADSIISYTPLKETLIKNNKEMYKNMPSWAKNVYQAECCMFNSIIMGMSAKEYRQLKNIPKGQSIRNTFTEKQLEYISELEKYDTDLIMVQNIFDYDKRKEILTKKYSLMN